MARGMKKGSVCISGADAKLLKGFDKVLKQLKTNREKSAAEKAGNKVHFYRRGKG